MRSPWLRRRDAADHNASGFTLRWLVSIVALRWSLLSRYALLRADLHPVTRKTRVSGTPGLRQRGFGFFERRDGTTKVPSPQVRTGSSDTCFAFIKERI